MSLYFVPTMIPIKRRDLSKLLVVRHLAIAQPADTRRGIYSPDTMYFITYMATLIAPVKRGIATPHHIPRYVFGPMCGEAQTIRQRAGKAHIVAKINPRAKFPDAGIRNQPEEPGGEGAVNSQRRQLELPDRRVDVTAAVALE